MESFSSFGEFFKSKRMEMGLTLREFCKEKGLDAGNISKLERGLIPAPKGEMFREKYANLLGIEKGSDEWFMFCDLAAASAKIIPTDIAEDKKLVEALPLFFRTVRNSGKKEKNLRELIEYIREQLK